MQHLRSFFLMKKHLNLSTPNLDQCIHRISILQFPSKCLDPVADLGSFFVPLQYELSSLSQDPLDSGKFWHSEGRNPGTQNNFVVSSILLGFFFVANVDTQFLINHLCKKVCRYIYCIHVCMYPQGCLKN